MTTSNSILLELAADCDAKRIRLNPALDGSLTIDAPRGAMTPEFLDRLKAHKEEILALLGARDFDVDNAPNAEPTPVTEPDMKATAICRCGSTRWRDVPIHDGQSIRRDCGRCSRFIEFAVWYGKNTGHKGQQSIKWFTWQKNALRN